MEDLYELTPKDLVVNLKKENEELKAQVQRQFLELQKFNSTSNSKLIDEIVAVFTKEAQKERGLIIQNLNEIKEINIELNQQMVLRTQNLEAALKEMVKTLQELIVSISEITLEFKEKNSATQIKNAVDTISESLQSANFSSNEDIKRKLEDIEVFMKNLKLLLSQIKF